MLPHKLHTLRRRRSKPIAIQAFGQNHHHALLILSPMKVSHQFVIAGIDRQHRIAEHLLARRIGPTLPQPGNPHRLVITPCNTRRHCFARAPVRFINRLRGNNAVLRTPPSVAKRRFFRRGLRARAVSTPSNFLFVSLLQPGEPLSNSYAGAASSCSSRSTTALRKGPLNPGQRPSTRCCGTATPNPGAGCSSDEWCSPADPGGNDQCRIEKPCKVVNRL